MKYFKKLLVTTRHDNIMYFELGKYFERSGSLLQRSVQVCKVLVSCSTGTIRRNFIVWKYNNHTIKNPMSELQLKCYGQESFWSSTRFNIIACKMDCWRKIRQKLNAHFKCIAKQIIKL